MERALPKSLHTISVLVNLARHLVEQDGRTPEAAVKGALGILNWSDAPDPYGLAAKALKTLAASPKPE